VNSCFVYDAVRTPFGRFGGGLAAVRPDDLAATVLAALAQRTPGLVPDEVVLGNANGAGEDNRNVARMALLLARYPVGVPGTTVNRLCGSSLDAAMVASRAIECGDASVVVAGGVESMTRAPWVLPKPDRAFPAHDVTAVSTTLGWRLANPAMPAEWTVSLGEANEQLQGEFGIDRARQDAFAARSHRLAHTAWAEGFYDDLVVPVPDTELTCDEGSGPTRLPRRSLASGPRSGRMAPSRPATPRRSATARPHCCSARPRPPTGSAASRSRASPVAVRPHWSRSGSATHRSRRPRSP
jgi:acetyl-CoA acyltransferase